MLKKMAVILVTLCGISMSAQSALIVSTDFNGRNIAPGSQTATGFSWTTNGVGALSGLTADASLFNTPDAQGLFAVDRNIQTEGPWNADITLNVLGQDISLSDLSFEAFIFSNAGVTQTISSTSRDVDFTVTIFDGSSNIVSQQSLQNVFPSSGSYVPGALVTMDFSSVSLLANSNYTLRLTASSDELRGNNAGIDNFNLFGTVVSVAAPETAVLFSVLLVSLFLRKKFA